MLHKQLRMQKYISFYILVLPRYKYKQFLQQTCCRNCRPYSEKYLSEPSMLEISQYVLQRTSHSIFYIQNRINSVQVVNCFGRRIITYVSFTFSLAVGGRRTRKIALMKLSESSMSLAKNYIILMIVRISVLLMRVRSFLKKMIVKSSSISIGPKLLRFDVYFLQDSQPSIRRIYRLWSRTEVFSSSLLRQLIILLMISMDLAISRVSEPLWLLFINWQISSTFFVVRYYLNLILRSAMRHTQYRLYEFNRVVNSELAKLSKRQIYRLEKTWFISLQFSSLQIILFSSYASSVTSRKMANSLMSLSKTQNLLIVNSLLRDQFASSNNLSNLQT